MARKNPRYLDPKDRTRYLDTLWTTIAQLDSREEVENFFRDLLSETEAIMLARRIIIAQQLLKGRSYDEISAELKSSPSTVAKVHRWLTSGFGGYEKTVKKLEMARDKRFKKELLINSTPYSFDWMKKKYPLHFALFNLLEIETKDKKK